MALGFANVNIDAFDLNDWALVDYLDLGKIQNKRIFNGNSQIDYQNKSYLKFLTTRRDLWWDIIWKSQSVSGGVEDSIG